MMAMVIGFLGLLWLTLEYSWKMRRFWLYTARFVIVCLLVITSVFTWILVKDSVYDALYGKTEVIASGSDANPFEHLIPVEMPKNSVKVDSSVLFGEPVINGRAMRK